MSEVKQYYLTKNDEEIRNRITENIDITVCPCAEEPYAGWLEASTEDGCASLHGFDPNNDEFAERYVLTNDVDAFIGLIMEEQVLSLDFDEI